MAKSTKKDEEGPQREREDVVLRRLLNTPPKPHKPKKDKSRQKGKK